MGSKEQREYGYCRISTPKQSIERQIRNVRKAYPKAKLYLEAYTGTTSNRKEWSKLLRIVQPGDVIVFDSVSRMSRNAEEGFADYQMLFEMGVELVFLKESHINTEVYRQALANQVSLTGDKVDIILQAVNQYMMEVAKEHIRLAFKQSEKEVQDLRQRTREGIETARLKGKQIGRDRGQAYTTKKSHEAKKVIVQHSKTFGGGLSDAECMRLAGVSKNTYYKYKQELLEGEISL